MGIRQLKVTPIERRNSILKLQSKKQEKETTWEN